MLELNQLPPPCKGGLVDSQPFVVVQISLQIGIFSLLSRCGCSPLFVWVGVLIGVHNPGITLARTKEDLKHRELHPTPHPREDRRSRHLALSILLYGLEGES